MVFCIPNVHPHVEALSSHSSLARRCGHPPSLSVDPPHLDPINSRRSPNQPTPSWPLEILHWQGDEDRAMGAEILRLGRSLGKRYEGWGR